MVGRGRIVERCWEFWRKADFLTKTDFDLVRLSCAVSAFSLV